jgi:hypothetical protein
MENFRRKRLNLKENNMKHYIFYGAGNRAEYSADVLNSQGIIPYCFADKDISKHGLTLCGKPVISLSEALSIHPNADIYITTIPQSWDSISSYLISTGLVKPEQIKNYDYPAYYSCCFIENDITLLSSAIQFCCLPGRKAPFFRLDFSESPEKIADDFVNFKHDTLQKLNSDEQRNI